MAGETLIAIGEALIDFIPQTTGCDFDQVEGFTPKVGGAPANVCGAFSRLGGSSRMITMLGDDPFGHKIERELNHYGIDTSTIVFTKEANTALAFVSLAEDGNRTFSFYRNPSADMLLDEKQVDKKWFEDVFALHFCSVSLGDFPMKKAHLKAISYGKEKGAIVSFDPNLRFPLWESKERLKEVVDEFIPYADVLKISDEELEFITGKTEIEDALPDLFRGDVKLVLYTMGKAGAYAFTKNTRAFVASKPVQAIDTTGAGDGFIGSILYKLMKKGYELNSLETLSEEDLKEMLAYSNDFCGISVQKKGAISSYPTSVRR